MISIRARVADLKMLKDMNIQHSKAWHDLCDSLRVGYIQMGGAPSSSYLDKEDRAAMPRAGVRAKEAGDAEPSTRMIEDPFQALLHDLPQPSGLDLSDYAYLM